MTGLARASTAHAVHPRACASHHVAIFMKRRGTLFAGDAGGVRVRYGIAPHAARCRMLLGEDDPDTAGAEAAQLAPARLGC